MTVHVGIDPSTKKFAVWAKCGSKNAFRTYDIDVGADISARIHAAFKAGHRTPDWLAKMFGADDYVVYQEAPVYVRGHQAVIKQSQCGGAFMAGLMHGGLYVRVVPVATWKKEVVGKGNAKKEDVAEWLRENRLPAYRKANGDQDVIDACCIAEYARAITRRQDIMA